MPDATAPATVNTELTGISRVSAVFAGMVPLAELARRHTASTDGMNMTIRGYVVSTVIVTVSGEVVMARRVEVFWSAGGGRAPRAIVTGI